MYFKIIQSIISYVSYQNYNSFIQNQKHINNQEDDSYIEKKNSKIIKEEDENSRYPYLLMEVIIFINLGD